MTTQSWFRSKSVVTPITAALFALVSVTGILLLAHVQSHAVKEMHELIGVLFVAGALVHVALNWRCFTSYLRKPVTIALGAGVGLLIVSLLLGTGGSGAGEGSPMDMLRLLETAPLAHVATLLDMEAEQAAEVLRRRGLSVVGVEQTIGDIARSNRRPVPEILSACRATGVNPDRP